LAKARIVIVEDEVIIGRDLKARLEGMGYSVIGLVASGEEVLDRVAPKETDLVLMDIKLGGRLDGIDAAGQLRSRLGVPVVFMTAYADEKILERAKLTEPYGYLVKPFPDKELQAAVEVALHRAGVEARLKESETLYRQLVDYAPAGIYEIDLISNRFLSVNDIMSEYTGYTREEFLALSPLDILTEASRRILLERMQRAAAGQTVPETAEYCFRTKSGQEKWIEVNTRLINKEGRPVRASVVAHDITARKQADSELRAERERFRTLAEESPLGLVLLKADGRYDYVNPAFERMFGYTQREVPTGRDWFRLAFPEPEYRHEAIAAWLNDLAESRPGQARPRVYSVVCKDGSQRIVHIRPVSLTTGDQLLIYEDITERVRAEEARARLEEQLRQVHKMEAVGTLAGGIAHDFNNILAAILGYTELAASDLPPGHPIGQNLEQVLMACHRAKKLVQQILSFSRPSDQERRPVQLGPVVEEALKLLRATLPTTIEIRSNLAPESGVVKADPTQIHQVLMNLGANAAYAMQDKGGLLEVTLERVHLDSTAAARRAELEPGLYEKLTVRDTGEGMDQEIVDRIFEPFFSTKSPLKGSGMGLAVVHGIVKSHGGSIEVFSRPGQGSTFQIYLPILDDQAAESRTEKPEPVPGGGERILLVDDEEAIVDTNRQMLERLGYRVSARTSSLEALELFKAGPDQFDLVITDQTMPRMTGVELAQEMLRLRPDLPIILCTGFSEQISAQQAEAMGIRRFAMKPLVGREVAQVVRQALDEKVSGPGS